MLAAKENGEWRTYSGSEVWGTAQKVAGGLLSHGIANQVLEPDQQEKIAIISPNRPEWMFVDQPHGAGLRAERGSSTDRICSKC